MIQRKKFQAEFDCIFGWLAVLNAIIMSNCIECYYICVWWVIISELTESTSSFVITNK